MKFREHRGSLEESMTTLVELKDRAELVVHIQQLLAPYDFKVVDKDVTVEPYFFDTRTNWNTHLVHLLNYGVMGYTDELC